MSYVQDNLLPNEKVLFLARVHPAIFLPSLIPFAAGIVFLVWALKTGSQNIDGAAILAGGLFIVFLFFVLCSIYLAIQALIIITTTEFAVTNRRVIAKRGFIRRHTLEILLSKVESMSVNQNILGRIVNFGNVTITGTGGTRETFRAIKDPVSVRRVVNQIIERYMQAYAEYQQQKVSTPKANV